MGSKEAESALLHRLRVRYELARLRRAFWGTLPVLVIGVGALLFTHRPWGAAILGFLSAIFALGSLWFGREPQRAVLPAVAAGLVPLVMALCANHAHVCGSQACISLCVPACTAGGLLAGVAVGGISHHYNERLRFWFPAGLLAVLVGAIGCSCAGHAGVIGLVAGFLVGTIPFVIVRLSAEAKGDGW